MDRMQAIILKGSVIPENTVIAAGTIISKKLTDSNCIYGGSPVSKLKDDLFGADRTFVACNFDSAANLNAVKWNSRPIFLDDSNR